MKLMLSFLLPSCLVLALPATVQAAFLQGVDNTWTTTTTEPDDYWIADPAITWAANDGVTVSFGDNTGNVGRLFIGMDHSSFAHSDGTLILTSTSGIPGTFELFGYHSADPIVGRLGHAGGGANHVGTITVDGGVSVIMGTHLMKYEGDAGNTINVLNGSLDYTAGGFGFRESSGNSTVNHVIGAGGSLTVPGVFTDASGFDAWAIATGNSVESGDITVAADGGLTLQFSNDGATTTITAIPEPAVAALGVLGFLGLMRRRR